MNKILGLDYGRRRTGVAISDPTGDIAFARATLSFKGEKKLFAELVRICKDEEIKTIIVGLPTNMKGEYTPQTDITLDFVERLKEHLPKMKIELLDERLSTVQAEKALIDKGLKKFSEIDEIAAQIILQAWLDRNKKATTS